MNRLVRLWSVSVLIGMFFICGWMNFSFAQDEEIDINALIMETQKMSHEPDEMSLVWWIPEEFWQVSFAQDPSSTEADVQEFLATISPYMIIAVVDGKVGAFGGITYNPESEIRASVQIKDNEGVYYQPLSEYEVDADVKNLLSMMKPVLANALGPMGQNLHFIVFPAKGKNGQNIDDAKSEGTFSVKLGEIEYKWRLPLSSLLPPKICPTCGEKLSGAYKFCPWDGTRLK